MLADCGDGDDVQPAVQLAIAGRERPVAVPVISNPSIPANDEPDERAHTAEAIDDRLAQIPLSRGVLIGSAQILALLPGISRSGITMVAGLWRGLSHEDAARFSFLLATPIILTAGVYKIPDLVGPLGAGIHGQVLAGSIASFICAYLAVRYLTRYFQTRTLTPFAIYCTLAGAVGLTWLATH